MKLHYKIALLIAVVGGIIGLATALGGAYVARDALDQELQRLGLYVGRTLALASRDELSAADRDLVADKLKRALEQNEAIDFLFVTDASGVVFAQAWRFGSSEELARLADLDVPSDSASTSYHDTPQGPIVHVSVPVPGEGRARVHVGLSDDHISEEIQRVRSLSLLMALTITLVGVLVALYISRSVTRPLASLMSSIHSYGTQTRSGAIAQAGRAGSDVERLAETFRIMMAERNQIERNLRESRRMLELVLDAIPVRVFWKDLGSVYLGCNRRFAADAGLGDPAKIIGHNDFEMPWREQAELYRQDDAEVIQTGKPKINYEEPQTGPGGRQLWLRTSKVPLTTDDGTIIGMLGTYEDITEARQAHQDLVRSERRFALAQKAGGIGTWEWEIATGRVYWSAVAEQIFGLEPGGFEGTLQAYLDRVHEDDLERVKAKIEEGVQTGRDVDIEHRIICPGQVVRIVAARGEVMRDDSGHAVVMLGVIRDVTDSREAEAALRRSERQLAEAQAIANLGSWELDLRTGEAIWSAEQYRLLGYEPFSVEGSQENLLKVVHLDDVDQVRAELERARRGEVDTLSIEHRLSRPDGSQRVVYERAHNILDAEGEPLRMLGTTLDVTGLRQAQQALLETESRLHSVVTSAPIVLFAIDSDGIFQLSEGQALGPLGLEPGEVVGQSVFEVYGDHPDIIADIEKALRGEAFFSYTRLGERRYEVYYGPWLDANGKTIGTTGVAVDDTERAQAQETLTEYREHLEELVEERTEALREANEELESFSYSVSHDLRAPLRAIDGFSRALIEDHAEGLDETGRDYLDRVHGAAQRMDELIDDLLQLSRVSRHELSFESVDLSAEARLIVDQLRAGDPERSVEVKIDATPTIMGDKRLLRVMLSNLLENAWKFTSKSEGARIEFYYTEKNGEGVYTIRDNGAGFDMKHSEKLFGPFQRLHRTEEFEGSGIGLATVKRVVSRHGGAVWAESESGKGAAFFFTLPGERRSRRRRSSGDAKH